MQRILDRSGGYSPLSTDSGTKIVIFRYYGQIRLIKSIIANMPRKPPIVFPQEQRLLSALGERLRLARKRRKLSNAVVAQRAGISRTTLYKVEAGDAGATLGSYVRVLAVLGLEGDLNQLGADDRVGRKLQDLELEPAPKRRTTTPAKAVKPSPASDNEEST
ncbi:helix-turn-helix domain-containing protein [Bordetella trematum]|uniref:helix-turn-helix domain-containing protein n=1 Tax=Bordetella trematum TaxID=123899 RepID=UPI003988F6D8